MTSEEIEATIKRIQEYGEHGCENVSQVVMAFMSGEQHREFQDKLISLLRQADPDTHIELPVDADGKVIHVGDWMVLTVCTTNESAKVEEKVVTVEAVDERGYYYRNRGSNDTRLWRACGSVSHHYHKPTVEELLLEFGKICQDGYDIGNSIHEYAERIREAMDE